MAEKIANEPEEAAAVVSHAQYKARLEAVCDVLSNAAAFGRQATDDEILAAIRGR